MGYLVDVCMLDEVGGLRLVRCMREEEDYLFVVVEVVDDSSGGVRCESIWGIIFCNLMSGVWVVDDGRDMLEVFGVDGCVFVYYVSEVVYVFRGWWIILFF